MTAGKKTWQHRLMEGWPQLDAGLPSNRLPEDHPDRQLWERIGIEADRRQAEFSEAASRLIARALGVKRLEAARRAAFHGGVWQDHDRYLIRRVALAVCRDLAPDASHTLSLVDRIAVALLAPCPNMAVAEARDKEDRRRRLQVLRDTPAANRLPC